MPLSRSLQLFSTGDVMVGAMHYLQVRDVAYRVAAQRQERTSERGAKRRKAGSGVALPIAGVQPRNRRSQGPGQERACNLPERDVSSFATRKLGITGAAACQMVGQNHDAGESL